MLVQSFLDAARRSIQSRRDLNRFRSRVVTAPQDTAHVRAGEQTLLNFASNDYLGLSRHPRVLRAAMEAMQSAGVGAGAAPLVTGHSPHHDRLEKALAKLKNTESAILLPSGYQANLAVVQMLAQLAAESHTPLRFLIDKLVHGSIAHAVRTSGVPFRVYPHNGYAKLERLLREGTGTQVVLTESIFSMDGDQADLQRLVDLKRAYPFLLVLDEAHATGVYGDAGAGLVNERGLSGVADIHVVTLSKAIGVMGGAVCSTTLWCDLISNLSPTYLFSTSLPPPSAAAALEALDVMRDEPERQQRVRGLAKCVREQLADSFEIPSGDSPIIPILLGDEESALQAAAQLRLKGMLIVPIRPPTVAAGSSRLRVTVSSIHNDDEISRLIVELLAIKK